MNKQELIEALEEPKNNIQFIVGMNKYNNFLRGKKEAYVNAIGLAKQLDEPQKPVVPCSVGSLIEFYREKGVTLKHILNCFNEWADTDNEHTDEVNWIVSNPETFMHAWLDGYEVEKEPLYIMPVPHVSFPVHYCVEDDHISFKQGNAQKFTQAELDRYFPDIKQFAVSAGQEEKVSRRKRND